MVATGKELFPLKFNAEVGAYVNSIRSALDTLAFAIFERGCSCREKDVCFPVAETEAKFQSGDYTGAKFVESLPQAYRLRIESIKPFASGNPTLWALHKLDIRRKHHRLLSVVPQPSTLTVGVGSPFSEYRSVAMPGYLEIGERVVVGHIPAGGIEPPIAFTAFVVMNEQEFVPRKSAAAVLREFATLATSVIAMFD